MRPSRTPSAVLLLPVALAAVCVAGCGDDARDLVESMGRAYREAGRYGDDGRVRITRTLGELTTEETHPFRVAFERPDRIRIDAYDVRIVSDGDVLRAAVGGVPGQVLAEPVASPLALDQLFADPELRTALAEGEAGCPTQLPLLLADDTVGLILGDATAPPRTVGAEEVDGHPCVRVTIPKSEGVLELWIDRDSKILRRMKVPSDAYAELLSQQSGAVTGMTVVVDFIGASFTAEIPAAAFAFELPAGAAEVPRLGPLRPPRPVSPQVGRRAEPFVLMDADGGRVEPDALAGAPAVLEFFCTGCEPCNRTMPQVAAGIARAAAARREAGRPAVAVRHLAVCVGETAGGLPALRRQLAEHGGVGEIRLDPRGEAAAAVGIEELPATVILGGNGAVVDVIVGEHPQIAADVAADLVGLADAADVAGAVRDRHATRLREYKDRLARAAGAGAGERVAAPPIPPRRQPVRFKLARAWRAADVALPGNLVCLDAAHGGGDEPRIVAVDGWRTVVEVAADGTAVARHELPLPPGAAVRFLQTAVDAEGRRWWLGGARGGRQVFVFDADWKLHAAYPPAEAVTSGGISAARLVDTDGDGTPEIVVGCGGADGLQAATLAGRRLWQERSVGAVRDVAVAPPGDGLLCLANDGRLLPVSFAGAAGGPLVSRDRRLTSLVTGPVAPESTWAAIGMAENPHAALGIGADGRVAWEVPLAGGGRREASLEPIAWADLLGTPRRQWLIAGADGAVTVAWADGRVVDTYRHGATLVGIGGYRHGGDGLIVLATRTSLEAFRMEDIALD